ncbi:hypothetical protein [Thermomonospora umbrina]|nr:hypothetical protein [Thermomonospora umbrina]
MVTRVPVECAQVLARSRRLPEGLLPVRPPRGTLLRGPRRR